MKRKKIIKYLEEKSQYVRARTLINHKIARGMRIASCLSDIEILTVLYYGKILNFNPKIPLWENRDRFIISKAHGAVSLYPILADFGYFDEKEMEKISQNGSLLSIIPDSSIPGFDIVIGSLGHGLGIACGVALALKNKDLKSKVIVLSGDGELFEGSVWEAVMFAGHHKLNNLIFIVDRNKKCMLGYCNEIINLDQLDEKFNVFNWNTIVVKDGHSIEELYSVFKKAKENKTEFPQAVIVNTIKGKGVPELECDPLCHIKSIDVEKIENIIKKL